MWSHTWRDNPARVRLNDTMTEIADVKAAASAAAAALATYADLDWQQVPAADLQWSCQQTALHLADCLYYYAMQVVHGRPAGYLCTELALDDTASLPRLMAAVNAHAADVETMAFITAPFCSARPYLLAGSVCK